MQLKSKNWFSKETINGGIIKLINPLSGHVQWLRRDFINSWRVGNDWTDKTPRSDGKGTRVRREFTGKGTVEESGIHELKFIKAVVKETLRLHPPAPLLLSRECRERCEINGYEIPVKTRVIDNAWAIGRDPDSWTEPERFNPERFLDSLLDYKGTDFEFIPFGAGRRMCPDMSFAIPNVELSLANFIYHFDWKLPTGIKPEDLDMTEIISLSVRRKRSALNSHSL